MEFELLGPVSARRNGRQIAIGSPREIRTLAILLLGRGQPVGYEAIIEALWGHRPPATAQAQIYSTVSRLRQHLGDDLLHRRGRAFAIPLDGHDMDLIRFERLAEQADQIGAEHPAMAADLLTSALALWRGPALSGLGNPVLGAAGLELDQLRVACQRRRIDYGLAALKAQSPRTQQLETRATSIVAAHTISG